MVRGAYVVLAKCRGVADGCFKDDVLGLDVPMHDVVLVEICNS